MNLFESKTEYKESFIDSIVKEIAALRLSLELIMQETQ